MSLVLAEFDSAAGLLRAAARLHELGYHRLEAYTPFPVAGLDAYLGARRSRIPAVVLAVACLGTLVAYLIEWGTVIDYPLNVARFPLQSLPAFIPIMFETTVLAGALTAFAAVFVRSGMLQWWHPLDEVEGFERAAIDRFFLSVAPPDGEAEAARRCAGELAACRPLRVCALEGRP